MGKTCNSKFSKANRAKLLSVSDQALKIATGNYDRMISFEQLHSVAKRATPNDFML